MRYGDYTFIRIQKVIYNSYKYEEKATLQLRRQKKTNIFTQIIHRLTFQNIFLYYPMHVFLIPCIGSAIRQTSSLMATIVSGQLLTINVINAFKLKININKNVLNVITVFNLLKI